MSHPTQRSAVGNGGRRVERRPPFACSRVVAMSTHASISIRNFCMSDVATGSLVMCSRATIAVVDAGGVGVIAMPPCRQRVGRAVPVIVLQVLRALLRLRTSVDVGVYGLV
jgi:hypothetical protein